MELNSSLYRCNIVHDRQKPKRNFFRYNIFMFMLDLDELPVLAKRNRLFSYNKFNVFSFFDKDHFKKDKSKYEDVSVKKKLHEYLLNNGYNKKPEKVLLLTHPRIFGHVFNPVSFYYCYDESGDIFCVITEVSNTYGEMKMYLLNDQEGKWFKAIHRKNFYISPFTKLDDYLDIKVGLPDSKLNIFISDFKDNEVKIKTMLSGKKKILSNGRLLKYVFRFPLITIQIVSLIHWQALKLWFKGVTYIPKDENPHLQKDIYYYNKHSNHANKYLQKNSIEAFTANEAGKVEIGN